MNDDDDIEIIKEFPAIRWKQAIKLSELSFVFEQLFKFMKNHFGKKIAGQLEITRKNSGAYEIIYCFNSILWYQKGINNDLHLAANFIDLVRKQHFTNLNNKIINQWEIHSQLMLKYNYQKSNLCKEPIFETYASRICCSLPEQTNLDLILPHEYKWEHADVYFLRCNLHGYAEIKLYPYLHLSNETLTGLSCHVIENTWNILESVLGQNSVIKVTMEFKDLNELKEHGCVHFILNTKTVLDLTEQFASNEDHFLKPLFHRILDLPFYNENNAQMLHREIGWLTDEIEKQSMLNEINKLKKQFISKNS